MTVSFFSEVAHHPTTLWVSIARRAFTHQLIGDAGGRFSLIALHNKQAAIALNCGSVSGRDQDKCKNLKLYNGSEGFLFLSEALSSTACRVRGSYAIDDQTLFIADILHCDVESRTSHLRQLLLSDL
jgi:flavin reductase (DIM6/NTAB) family NADH-FMN oxidoreductase RutF